MNASEDGDEPVGEVPVLGGFQIFGTSHLGGPHRTPLAARQTEALNVIRELHVEEPSKLLTQPSHCAECYLDWPCATVRAIQERGL